MLGNVEYASSITPVIMDYYAEYFGVQYPMPKLGKISRMLNYSQTRMAVRYGTIRICVLHTSHLESYRTSVPYFSSIFEAYHTNVPYPYHYKKRRTIPTYRTRTITKKAYHTSVPYFLAKIEAYRTVLPFLRLTTRNFN